MNHTLRKSLRLFIYLLDWTQILFSLSFGESLFSVCVRVCLLLSNPGDKRKHLLVPLP